MKKLILLICLSFFTISHIDLCYAYKVQRDYYKLKMKYVWLHPKLYETIKMESAKNKLPVALVCAIIQNESRGKERALSKKGAMGLMQVMPFHLEKEESIYVLYNPEINIKKGCKILKTYLTRANNNLIEGLKNYNSGPNSKYYNIKYIYRTAAMYFETLDLLI